MEAAEPPLSGDQRDDHLDVGALGVMAHVDEHARALAEPLADRHRRAPIRDVGGVERRLEELVLDQQLLLGRQRGVELAQAVHHAFVSRGEIVLARIVGAVGEPQRLCGRAQLACYPDALEQMFERLRPDRGVGVGDRAEPVVGILKQVGVHGAEAQAEILGVAAQRGEVIDRVPREVQRHGRGGTGQPMHLRRVVEALEHIARAARLRKGREPGAGVTVAPRGRLDDQRGQRCRHGPDIAAILAQPARQVVVIVTGIRHGSAFRFFQEPTTVGLDDRSTSSPVTAMKRV